MKQFAMLQGMEAAASIVVSATSSIKLAMRGSSSSSLELGVDLAARLGRDVNGSDRIGYSPFHILYLFSDSERIG